MRVGETHEKKTDLETQMATRSSKLETVVLKSCVLDCKFVELQLILDPVRTATEDGEMHVGEREIFATTKEKIEHVIAGQMSCLGICRIFTPKVKQYQILSHICFFQGNNWYNPIWHFLSTSNVSELALY